MLRDRQQGKLDGGQAAGLGDGLDQRGGGERCPRRPCEQGEGGQEQGAVVGPHHRAGDVAPGRDLGGQVQGGDHDQRDRDPEDEPGKHDEGGHAPDDIAEAAMSWRRTGQSARHLRRRVVGEVMAGLL